jgi:hypothetical protein
MTPWGIFTTHYFLRNLQSGPISLYVTYSKQESLARDKHFSLLCLFLSYGENKIL